MTSLQECLITRNLIREFLKSVSTSSVTVLREKLEKILGTDFFVQSPNLFTHSHELLQSKPSLNTKERNAILDDGYHAFQVLMQKVTQNAKKLKWAIVLRQGFFLKKVSNHIAEAKEFLNEESKAKVPEIERMVVELENLHAKFKSEIQLHEQESVQSKISTQLEEMLSKIRYTYGKCVTEISM